MIPGSASQFFLGASKAAASSSGYQIERSLRFNSSDSAYCSRVPASAGNRKTWTWAGWVKRCKPGSIDHVINGVGGGSPSYSLLYIYSSDTLDFDGGGAGSFSTTQVFRDSSAWYHIVLAFDTTQATSSNRIKLWINGQQVTAFNSISYPTQNADGGLNQAGLHKIGNWSSEYSNFYLADIHFIDGQALDPSSFTETDAITGQLIPKTYTGSYGTNGFRLPFSDNSAATATTLGKDAAGSNNWTPNNLSVTAGAGNDSLVDSPTNYGTDTGAGGEVRGNYCTWNPLDNAGTLANGNLDFSNSAASNQAVRSTFGLPESGKWYAEFTTGSLTNGSSGVAFGFANSSASLTAGPSAINRWTIYADSTGYIFANNTTLSSSLGTFAAGTTLQIAYDAATGKAWVGKNNTWYNSSGGTTGDPAAGTNQTFTLSGTQFLYTLCYANSGALNAGQRAFAYTAPSGFKALCTQNLPTPVVAQGSTVMDVALDSGANILTATKALCGGNANFLWIKDRVNNSTNHRLIDILRDPQLDGTPFLASNSTSNETTLGTYSAPSGNSVGWAWYAGATTDTNNTAGSIVPTGVRANATAGFSVVSFTSQSSGIGTVGHGLNVAPTFTILKIRTLATDWHCYHTSIGAGNEILLNTTGASSAASVIWNNTAPTSTVLTLGIGWAGSYSSIAYCFAPVAGYSNGFSYTGNGSTDGVFVYLGLRAKLLLIKRTDSTGNWYLWDTVRNTYNVVGEELYPNLSNAASTATDLDILSNGFKMRATTADFNASGGTYIGYAWAEAPFAYSRAR